MKKSVALRLARHSLAAAALAAGLAASFGAGAQTLWGGQSASEEKEKTAPKTEEKKQPPTFLAAEIPNEGFLRALSRASLPGDGAADCILAVRTGSIAVKGSESGDYLKAWSAFVDQEGVAPIGGMELGLKSGVLAVSRISTTPAGVGGEKGVFRAFVLTKGATATFDKSFEPLLTPAPGASAPKKAGELGLQVLFGDGGERVAVKRDTEAANQGAGNVSHYSLRQGEALILALPGDGEIRWIALVAFPLPQGALSEAK